MIDDEIFCLGVKECFVLNAIFNCWQSMRAGQGHRQFEFVFRIHILGFLLLVIVSKSCNWTDGKKTKTKNTSII